MENNQLSQLITQIDADYEAKTNNCQEKYRFEYSGRFVEYQMIKRPTYRDQFQTIIFAEFKDDNCVIQHRIVLITETNANRKLSDEALRTSINQECRAYVSLLSTFYSDASARNNFCQQLKGKSVCYSKSIVIPIFLFYYYLQKAFPHENQIMCELYDLFNLRADAKMSQTLNLRINHQFQGNHGQVFSIRNGNISQKFLGAYNLFETTNQYFISSEVKYGEKIEIGSCGDYISESDYKQLINNKTNRKSDCYIYVKSLSIFQIQSNCRCVSVKLKNSGQRYRYICKRCSFISLVSDHMIKQLNQLFIEYMPQENIFSHFYTKFMKNDLDINYSFYKTGYKLKNLNMVELRKHRLNALRQNIQEKANVLFQKIGYNAYHEALYHIETQPQENSLQLAAYSANTYYKYDFTNKCIILSTVLDLTNNQMIKKYVESHIIAALMPKCLNSTQFFNIDLFISYCSPIIDFIQENFIVAQSNQNCPVCLGENLVLFKPAGIHNSSEQTDSHGICCDCFIKSTAIHIQGIYSNLANRTYYIPYTCSLCRQQQEMVFDQQQVDKIKLIYQVLYLNQ